MVNFREFLRYESGSLIWIKKPGNRSTVKIGSIAGTRCQQGYVRVRLFGKSYLAHRVVWELISGLITSGMQDDHINQQQDRIESLEKKNGDLGQGLQAAEKRIAGLVARLATPVRLSCETHPRCRTQHAKDIRAAGFKVEGDE